MKIGKENHRCKVGAALRLKNLTRKFDRSAAASVLVSFYCFASMSYVHAQDRHHRHTGQYTLTVVDSLQPTSKFRGSLGLAMTNWSRGFTTGGVTYNPWMTLTSVAGVADGATRRDCPTIVGQVRVCDYDYGKTSWAAEWGGRVRDIGGGHLHITEGRVRFNVNGSSGYSQHFLKYLVCHEMGHAVGLIHSPAGTASGCMGGTTTESPSLNEYIRVYNANNHIDAASRVKSSSSIPSLLKYPQSENNNKANINNLSPTEERQKEIDGLPKSAQRVHKGVLHETWIAPDGDDGYYVYEFTLAPGFENFGGEPE